MAMTLEDLVTGVRDSCGGELIGAVLYGSAAGRDYHDRASDQNVLLLMRSADSVALGALAPVVRRWTGIGNPPPLLLTVAEWRQRADVFAIEYADVLERHRVLFGVFPVDGVRVRRRDLRLQLESEVMGKLLRFRRGFMNAGGDANRVRALLEESLSAMLALLRATLHLHGEDSPVSSAALCDRAAALAGFDPRAFQAALAHRTGAAKLSDAAIPDVVRGYLESLELLLAHVDAYAADD